MKKTRIRWLILLVVVLCGFWFFLHRTVSQSQSQSPVIPESYSSENVMNVFVPLHDWELDYRWDDTQQDAHMLDDIRMYGGIVPHHLLAQSFITEMFERLSSQKHVPKTIIILSPNHEEDGDAFVQTADVVWQTPEGMVNTDQEKVHELTETLHIPVQNEYMKKEHGMYNIVPFVKHFLPQAKVVPITVRFATSVADQDALAQLLSTWLLQEDVAVIASIDFSHYLTTAQASQKDYETKKAIHDFDYSRIAQFHSEHVDTPGGLAIFLKTMHLANASQELLLKYDNSGEVLHQKFSPTTSHFLYVFVRK